MNSPNTHTLFQAFARLVVCVALVVASIPVVACADDTAPSTQSDSSSSQVVRVGYLNSAGYEEGGEGQYKSGWGYEYLQTLSYHTGWTYEYVYGNFSELMEKLQAGDIDLMCNISYTDERAQTLLFSQSPQGEERYYVCVKSDNDELSGASASAFTGKRIGVIDGLIQTQAGEQWMADHGAEPVYANYPNSRALFDALDKGDIDAIFMDDATTSPSAVPVITVGSSSYYLAVPKTRPDLMEQINDAMADIQSSNSRYNDEVKTKYSASGSGSQYLTASEKAWLEQRNWHITLGYLDHALPYSATDSNNQVTGSVTALISELSEAFGITVDTRAYDHEDTLVEAVKSGEADAAIPVANNFWVAEQHGVAQSDVFATTSIVAVFTGDNVGSCLDTVACARTSVIDSDIFSALSPTSNVMMFDGMEQCVQALRTGSVHAVLIPSTSLETFREQYRVDDMKTAELTSALSLSAYVTKGNSELLTVLNKSIANAKTSIQAATLSHYSYADEGSPVVKFFKRNIVTILLLVVFVLVAGSVVLLRALRRARRAEIAATNANQAKTKFLARMSHDIRTPLNGIIGLMEIGDLHPDDRQRAADIRTKTKGAADHLLALLSDVLEMGKLEDRDIELENVPFNLMDALRDVEVLGSLRAAETGVTVIHDGGVNLTHVNLYGSPVHIKRVFINLLTNAIKYNEPGGQVKCTSSVERESGDTVAYRFVIADTGIGMSPEFVEHIFEPFSQERDDARSTYQGTGMGMAIVHALVQKMGGTISVQSELGCGSTFEVVLPFTIDRNPAAHESAAPDAADCSIEGMNLLLVEDNELNREIAETLLEEMGARVTFACDGKQAVDAFVGKPAGTFDAVLMDIMMPVMNGYEASRAIRLSGKRDADTIVIVAMTANAFVEDVQASKEAGMNEHLAKPIDMDKLKAALARLVK